MTALMGLFGAWALTGFVGVAFLLGETRRQWRAINVLRASTKQQQETIEKLVAIVGGGESRRLLTGEVDPDPDDVQPIEMDGFEWNMWCDMVVSCPEGQRYKAFREGRPYWCTRELKDLQYVLRMLPDDQRDNALAYFTKHRKRTT